MGAMEPERIAELLEGPLQAVLSVSRRDRGPVAVPMSYHFGDGTFWMVTSPESLHGRLMVRRGRATVTASATPQIGSHSRTVSSVRAVANGVLSSLNATRSTTSVWSWRG